MRTTIGVDKLAGDSNTIACLAHAAFEDVAHAKLATNPLRVDRLALVAKARVTRNHMQIWQLGEVGDDVLADTVRKILLLSITAHIVEGEDSDRMFNDRRHRRSLGFRSQTAVLRQVHSINAHRSGNIL